MLYQLEAYLMKQWKPPSPAKLIPQEGPARKDQINRPFLLEQTKWEFSIFVETIPPSHLR